MKNNILITLIFLALMTTVFISCQQQKDEIQQKEMTITTSSEEALALFLKGRDFYDMTKKDSAAIYFDKAIALDSNFALAYDYRSFSGTDYLSRKKARKKAYDLIDEVSRGEKYWILNGYFWADNDVENTMKYLDSFLLLYPEDKRGVYFTGAAHHYLANDYEKAIQYYDKALELDKNFILVYLNKKNAQVQLGQLDEAEKTIQQHLQLMPDEATPYFSHGELLTKLGRFDQSIEQHNKALKLDPELKYTNIQLGHNYTLKGEYEKAREFYWKFADPNGLETEKLGPLFWEAVTYLYEDNLDGFLNNYKKYRVIAEKNELWRAYINSYVVQAGIFAWKKNTIEGQKYLNKAYKLLATLPLEDKPKKDISNWIDQYQHFIYVKENRLDKAEPLLKKIEKNLLESDLPNREKRINELLAFYEMEQGNFEKAIGLFSQGNKKDPIVIYFTADCFEKSGDKAKALEYYRKIKNLNEVSWPAGVVWNDVLNKIEVLTAELQAEKVETS